MAGDIPPGSGIGDLWTFSCPSGGHFSLEVQPRSTSAATVSWDPYAKVFDGLGNPLTASDDITPCVAVPACGFGCPQLTSVGCGPGSIHSLEIRSGSTGFGCGEGGSYTLTLSVQDSLGRTLSDIATKLGGGPKSKVPKWADPTHVLSTGPAIDNGMVP